MIRMGFLIRREGRFSVRLVVPQPLRGAVGKVELVKSLKTTDLVEANKRAPRWISLFQQIIEQAKRDPLETEVRRYLPDAIRNLENWEDSLDAMEWRDKLDTPDGRVVQAVVERARAAQGKVDTSPTLSKLFDLYLKEAKPTITSHHGVVVARWVALHGDSQVAGITKVMVRDYKTALQKMPGKKPGSTMSGVTLSRHLASLQAVLTYGVRHDYLTTNPLVGLVNHTKQSETVQRRPYTREQAKAILAALPKDLLWPIRLLAFSGCRLSEVMGLRPEDVKDGVLDVRPTSERRLKTPGSTRQIPIHSKLIELGFSASLLPFKVSANSVSHKYGRLLYGLGLDDPSLVIHSWRHTVTTQLHQAGVLESVIEQLLGWSNGKMARRYFGGHTMSALKEAIERVSY